MWLRRDLDDGRADREARAGRKIRRADIEIDVELIARQSPPRLLAGNHRNHARVHHVDLHVRMGQPVWRSPAVADVPRVANETSSSVELTSIEDVTSPDGWPANDQFERAFVLRRLQRRR